MGNQESTSPPVVDFQYGDLKLIVRDAGVAIALIFAVMFISIFYITIQVIGAITGNVISRIARGPLAYLINLAKNYWNQVGAHPRLE